MVRRRWGAMAALPLSGSVFLPSFFSFASHLSFKGTTISRRTRCWSRLTRTCAASRPSFLSTNSPRAARDVSAQPAASVSLFRLPTPSFNPTPLFFFFSDFRAFAYTRTARGGRGSNRGVVARRAHRHDHVWESSSTPLAAPHYSLITHRFY